MQISKSMEKAINEQINRELFSEYLYLAMAAWCYSENWNGFGHFFEEQAKEERAHAMKFFHYLFERRGTALVGAIEKPQGQFKSVEETFELTLEHEQQVTAWIHGLMDLAIKENDHASVSFLKWFVDEQVEEEATADGILQQLKKVNGNINGLFALDHRLGERGKK